MILVLHYNILKYIQHHLKIHPEIVMNLKQKDSNLDVLLKKCLIMKLLKHVSIFYKLHQNFSSTSGIGQNFVNF